jgi:hypothetical protein
MNTTNDKLVLSKIIDTLRQKHSVNQLLAVSAGLLMLKDLLNNDPKIRQQCSQECGSLVTDLISNLEQ